MPFPLEHALESMILAEKKINGQGVLFSFPLFCNYLEEKIKAGLAKRNLGQLM